MFTLKRYICFAENENTGEFLGKFHVDSWGRRDAEQDAIRHARATWGRHALVYEVTLLEEHTRPAEI